MLLATISFRAQPYKRAEALSAADALAQRMRAVAGCGRCRVLTDSDDTNTFMVVSEWTDAAGADSFFDSRDFQIFKGVRILMRDDPYIVLDDVRTRVTRPLTAP